MLNEMRGQLAELSKENQKLSTELKEEKEATAKIVKKANRVEEKLGKGKILTPAPSASKEGDSVSYNLPSDNRANSASLAAINILKERNVNANKKIYDPNNQMEI
jgi:hypothetical protein